MTLHIFYDHQCPRCGAYYIPYDERVPCPNCGLIEEERFDYIPEAVSSLKYNLETTGSFMPPAWWVSSLGDHILFILFHVFEEFRQKQKGMDFEEFVDGALSKMEWKDQQYLRKHIFQIAIRVYEELQNEGIL